MKRYIKSSLCKYTKKECIDAIQWMFGYNKAEANRYYATANKELLESVVDAFKSNAKKSFIYDSTNIEGSSYLADRNIVSNEDVDELVLYITNDGRLYRNRTTSIINNLARKMKSGKYDSELAVKAWQYLADDGVRQYDREYGSGRGSLTLLPKNTRVEIAKELRDYYLEDVEGIANGDYDFY